MCFGGGRDVAPSKSNPAKRFAHLVEVVQVAHLARRDGGDEEGQDVHDGVDLPGDAHVEEHDGADEHAEEADQEEVANRVGVVIGEGDGGGVLVILLTTPFVSSCPNRVSSLCHGFRE